MESFIIKLNPAFVIILWGTLMKRQTKFAVHGAETLHTAMDLTSELIISKYESLNCI